MEWNSWWNGMKLLTTQSTQCLASTKITYKADLHSVGTGHHCMARMPSHYTFCTGSNDRFSSFSIVFGPKRGPNDIRFEFWVQIWNPLIISDILDPHLIWFSHFDFMTSHAFSLGKSPRSPQKVWPPPDRNPGYATALSGLTFHINVM